MSTRPVLTDPIERTRFIQAMRGRGDLNGRQRQLLTWAERRQARASSRRDLIDRFSMPLSASGGLGAWVDAFNRRVGDFASALTSESGDVLRVPGVTAWRPRKADRNTPAGFLRVPAGRNKYGRLDYKHVSVGGAGIALSGVQAWMDESDRVFRSAVVLSADRRGAEWADRAWREWPLYTGASRSMIDLRWVLFGGNLVLQFVSAAPYTLVAKPTAQAFGRARAGLRRTLVEVANDVATGRAA
jgi:hypothetical protein